MGSEGAFGVDVMGGGELGGGGGSYGVTVLVDRFRDLLEFGLAGDSVAVVGVQDSLQHA